MIFQYGFKVVAEYKMFHRNTNNSWDVYEATCFQNGEHCVIRVYHKRHQWTLEYFSKEQANNKIKELIKEGYKRQK